MHPTRLSALTAALLLSTAACDDGDATPAVADAVTDVGAEVTSTMDSGTVPDASAPDATIQTDADVGPTIDPATLKPNWTALGNMPQPLWGTHLTATEAGVLVGFGGNALPAGNVSSATWIYSPAADQWGGNAIDGAPPARYCHCMAAMPERKAFLVVGGRNADGDLPPGAWVYAWDTQTWTSVSGPLPAGTIGCHAGWLPDLDGGRVVVWGGQGTTSTDPGGMDLTTWLFDPDALAFTAITTGNTPPGRRDGAVASDVAGGRVLVWGGQTQGFPTPAHTDDMWAFDGTNWSPVAADGAGPGPRRYPAAAFAPQRRLWVVYSGTLETYDEDDFWLFDAATDTWHPLDTTDAPAPRAFAPMAWDAKTQAFYMFGGGTAMITTAYQDGYKLVLE